MELVRSEEGTTGALTSEIAQQKCRKPHFNNIIKFLLIFLRTARFAAPSIL